MLIIILALEDGLRESDMKSTGITRSDGLSVSVHTRTAPEAEKEPGLLVVEVNIPLDTLKDFVTPAAGEPAG